MHGYRISRVCPVCGERISLKFISDCRLGSCGRKDTKYNGADKIYECPICKNVFSWESKHYEQDRIKSS